MSYRIVTNYPGIGIAQVDFECPSDITRHQRVTINVKHIAVDQARNEQATHRGCRNIALRAMRAIKISATDVLANQCDQRIFRDDFSDIFPILRLEAIPPYMQFGRAVQMLHQAPD